jgi:hypothetical protein
MGLTGWCREDVKLRLFADIYAPKRPYRCRLRTIFESEFPTVARFILSVNSGRSPDAYGELIRRLQRLEARLVIESVAPLLVKRCSIVTLHDSIFSRRENIGLVRDAFNETFDRIGFRVQLKDKVCLQKGKE